MFASIFCMAIILGIAFKLDYRMLVSDGNRKQWVIYSSVFTIGFVLTVLYAIDPAIPGLMSKMETPMQPLRAWFLS